MVTKIDKIGEWLLQIAHICALSYTIAKRLDWLDEIGGPLHFGQWLLTLVDFCVLSYFIFAKKTRLV